MIYVYMYIIFFARNCFCVFKLLLVTLHLISLTTDSKFLENTLNQLQMVQTIKSLFEI